MKMAGPAGQITSEVKPTQAFNEARLTDEERADNAAVDYLVSMARIVNELGQSKFSVDLSDPESIQDFMENIDQADKSELLGNASVAKSLTKGQLDKFGDIIKAGVLSASRESSTSGAVVDTQEWMGIFARGCEYIQGETGHYKTPISDNVLTRSKEILAALEVQDPDGRIADVLAIDTQLYVNAVMKKDAESSPSPEQQQPAATSAPPENKM